MAPPEKTAIIELPGLGGHLRDPHKLIWDQRGVKKIRKVPTVPVTNSKVLIVQRKPQETGSESALEHYCKVVTKMLWNG